MRDMFIPSLFDMPTRRAPSGKVVSGTMNKSTVLAMVSALESVGLFVRHENKGFSCHVSGKALLVAHPGNRGTYQVRYAQDVLKLVGEKK